MVDLIDEFSDGRIQFSFLKIKDPNTSLPKSVLIGWCGEGVPERTKGYFTSHLAAVAKVLHVRATTYPAAIHLLIRTIGLSCTDHCSVRS